MSVMNSSRDYLNQYERLLMQLTEYELGEHATFLDGGSGFRLTSLPSVTLSNEVPLGLYELPRRSGEAHLYRLGHPLARYVLRTAQTRELPAAEIEFDYTGHRSPIAAVAPYVGQRGELLLSQLTVEALDQTEDYLLFAAMTDDGRPLDEDAARRLFSLDARGRRGVPKRTSAPRTRRPDRRDRKQRFAAGSPRVTRNSLRTKRPSWTAGRMT